MKIYYNFLNTKACNIDNYFSSLVLKIKQKICSAISFSVIHVHVYDPSRLGQCEVSFPGDAPAKTSCKFVKNDELKKHEYKFLIDLQRINPAS